MEASTSRRLPLLDLRGQHFLDSASKGLWDNRQFWVEAKEMVDNHLQAVLGNPGHPRFADYNNVNGLGNILLAMTAGGNVTAPVTADLWQVVADYKSLER